MPTLDELAQSIPAHQIAGRFGVQLLAVLRPRGEGARGGEGGWRLQDPARPLDLEGLFARSTPPRVSLASLRERLLVARPRGEFFSLDEVSLRHARREDERLTVELLVTRPESPDGEPAPRDLFILLGIDAGVNPPRRLSLTFDGRGVDTRGNETPLAVTSGEPLTIEFED